MEPCSGMTSGPQWSGMKEELGPWRDAVTRRQRRREHAGKKDTGRLEREGERERETPTFSLVEGNRGALTGRSRDDATGQRVSRLCKAILRLEMPGKVVNEFFPSLTPSRERQAAGL